MDNETNVETDNKNEPTNPIYFKDGELNSIGLTKLEFASIMALQGILANGNYKGNGKDFVAGLAIEYAYELCKQLE